MIIIVIIITALLLVLLTGLTEMLPNGKDFTKIIDELLTHTNIHPQHLEFLLVRDSPLLKKYHSLQNAGMAIKKCKTSSVKLDSLLQRFDLSFDLIKALVQHGTQPCPNSIEYAIYQNNYKLFHYLTAAYSSLKNANFAFLDTSLLISKFSEIDIKLFQTILKKGCIALGINAKLPTPLLCAVEKGRYDIAALLIECGANLLGAQFAKHTTVVHEATNIALHTGMQAICICIWGFISNVSISCYINCDSGDVFMHYYTVHCYTALIYMRTYNSCSQALCYPCWYLIKHRS